MRNPLSDKVVEMKPSGIRKFFDLVQEMPNAISLGVGEPDFDTPWHIREEGIYSLEKGRTFYTSNAGLLELRKAIAHYMYRKYDLEYDPVHEIVVTVGGSEGIDLALRAMINPGDEVILPEPAFVSYLPCIKLADGVPVTINLKEEATLKKFVKDDKYINVFLTLPCGNLKNIGINLYIDAFATYMNKNDFLRKVERISFLDEHYEIFK